jgi:hypothetical protein
MVIKEIGDIVAIFDSKGRKFNGRDDLKIGRAIDVDKLFTVVAETKKTRTKQANTRALQLSKHRPESISLKSVDLEAINHSQSNAAYAVTTAIVSNINEQDKVASSYYLGVGSGRICDQKNSKFSYEEFIEWIDHINILFAANQQTKSAFLNSYSQAVEYLPTEDPTLCILDLTDISGLIEVGYNGFRQNIDNTFIYKRYNRGISFFNLYYHPDDDTINKLENFISFEFNEKKRFMLYVILIWNFY